LPEKFSKEERSRIMARIHSTNTKCELILRRALRKAGLFGYRVNYRDLPGKPDIVFLRKKLIIFCDSDFWHGKKGLPTINKEYWEKKLQKNAERDKAVNLSLTLNGWAVLRFSEKEIIKNSEACVETIKNALANVNTS
jgi:DNA mismatch endonuclease, patch repair protein